MNLDEYPRKWQYYLIPNYNPKNRDNFKARNLKKKETFTGLKFLIFFWDSWKQSRSVFKVVKLQIRLFSTAFSTEIIIVNSIDAMLFRVDLIVWLLVLDSVFMIFMKRLLVMMIFTANLTMSKFSWLIESQSHQILNAIDLMLD